VVRGGRRQRKRRYVRVESATSLSFTCMLRRCESAKRLNTEGIVICHFSANVKRMLQFFNVNVKLIRASKLSAAVLVTHPDPAPSGVTPLEALFAAARCAAFARNSCSIRFQVRKIQCERVAGHEMKFLSAPSVQKRRLD
jgi:hypothetical protein